jgi:hypothetical protein
MALSAWLASPRRYVRFSTMDSIITCIVVNDDDWTLSSEVLLAIGKLIKHPTTDMI